MVPLVIPKYSDKTERFHWRSTKECTLCYFCCDVSVAERKDKPVVCNVAILKDTVRLK